MGQIIVKSLEEIKVVIKRKKFLLVHDTAYELLEIKDFFDGFSHAEFSEFTPNPLYEQICRGIEIFHKEKCEMIVAVGGGSTIDVAKCIKLYCMMDNSINYLEQKASDSGIILIAIPTTAGTGSESSRHAVIYYEGVKQSISHISIVPDYVVLKSSVLKTLPSYQKKCTMMDALSQAIESWWSVASTDESIGYSRKAIQLIKDNWEEYIFENNDYSAGQIMEAANLSGRAINITATTAAHAMSYKITSMYKFPHGHAVAVCLPEVWIYMMEHTADCTDIRGAGYLEQVLDQIANMIDVKYYKTMFNKMKMQYPVSMNKNKELEMLARSVNLVRLKNNPVELNMDVLRKMYGRIIQ